MRRDTMPVIAAVLGEHLGGQQRVRTVAELLELMENDLFELRGRGFDLPRTAQEYLSDWVSSRLVIRRPSEGREETVELSPSAQSALRFIASIESPSSSVTSSRLATVTSLLSSLARETDPDPTSRLEALIKERESIERSIQEVEAGRYEPMTTAMALERIAEIMTLANEVPGDFARVSEDIEQLNRSLRDQIIRQAGTRGSVLDQVFAGVDAIDNSDAGQSFNAFYSLVLDPERANNFDESVEAILSRDFALTLTDTEVAALRRWLSVLQSESSRVRNVMTSLARSLRRFVESHAYLEQRRLTEAVNEAKNVLHQVSKQLRPQTQAGYELASSSIPISSISSWNLLNPADTQVQRKVKVIDDQPLDLEELRRQIRLSEIDFGELRQSVIQVLDKQAVASISEILDSHPATQGLASVIGLIVLADTVGLASPEIDVLSWQSSEGQTHTAETGRRVFHTIPDDWR
ncbi:MAG: DUF3375 domain-containing protein [Coriobacteriia bacterium]|nr:DUF3375 domain-containing protein [Coriobacteriia bacterium]